MLKKEKKWKKSENEEEGNLKEKRMRVRKKYKEINKGDKCWKK